MKGYLSRVAVPHPINPDYARRIEATAADYDKPMILLSAVGADAGRYPRNFIITNGR